MPLVAGMANYLCLGRVSKAYRAVDQHTRKRLRQWLCIKHKVKCPGKKEVQDRRFLQGAGAGQPYRTDRRLRVGETVSFL